MNKLISNIFYPESQLDNSGQKQFKYVSNFSKVTSGLFTDFGEIEFETTMHRLHRFQLVVKRGAASGACALVTVLPV